MEAIALWYLFDTEKTCLMPSLPLTLRLSNSPDFFFFKKLLGGCLDISSLSRGVGNKSRFVLFSAVRRATAFESTYNAMMEPSLSSRVAVFLATRTSVLALHDRCHFLVLTSCPLDVLFPAANKQMVM